MQAVDAERRLPTLPPSTPSLLTREDTEETMAEMICIYLFIQNYAYFPLKPAKSVKHTLKTSPTHHSRKPHITILGKTKDY